MNDSVNIREIALDIVTEVMKGCENAEYSENTLSHVVIGRALRKYQYLDKRDRSFLTRLTEGTIENIIHLDYIINEFSTVTAGGMKPFVRNLLRISVYQIKFMDSVPDSAVCNEAVKLAAKRGFGKLKGFVNGVLRNISRNIDNIKYPDASKDLMGHLSIICSVPEWLAEKYFLEFGAEEASKILKQYMKHEKELCVRCNVSKASADQIEDMLKNEGVCVRRGIYYDKAFYISDYDYLEKLSAFREGYIQVQDLSSMLTACIANPGKNILCVDMCAAPGGKTLHLADMMAGTGSIIARDINDHKIELINDNLARMNYTNVRTEIWDAKKEDPELFGKADLVMADVPCSGLGVVGKKSDIKYRLSEEKIKELVHLQREILKNAVKYLKPGGVLIYSTCTILKEENIENVVWLKDNYGLVPEDISGLIHKRLVRESCKDGYIQIMPGEFGSDGFFICRLKNEDQRIGLMAGKPESIE